MRFSELGMRQDEGRKVFDCPQISVTDVLNEEIEVLDFIPGLTTQHGDGRALIRVRTSDGREGKFFTASKTLCGALEQVRAEMLPFTTVIRCVRCGASKMYRFT